MGGVDPRPSILFIHGGWHSSVHFQPFLEFVRSHGYNAICPDLPTAKGLPKTDAYEDSECIQSELRKLIEDGSKEVIVIMHSYGGFVGSLACQESYGQKVRQSKGLSGGIIQLVFMAALIFSMDQPLLTLDNKGIHPSVEIRVTASF